MGKRDSLRLKIVFAVFLLAATAIAWRLFVLSYIRHTLYAKTAEAQDQNISNILIRGNIFIQDPKASDATGQNYLVATDKKFPYAYVTPTDVTDKSVADQVASILKLDPTSTESIFQSGSSSTKILAHRLTPDQVTAINGLNTKGVGVGYETDRYYPNGTMLSNVLGFLGYGQTGRQGQYGIEGYFDDELSGQADASGGAPRPADVVLTIDKNIQNFIENELAQTMAKWKASGGTIIVQDPKTGAVLGMADWPNFDPNSYANYPTSTYLNTDVQAVFEPGSSFKPVTMSAGIDLGKVTPDTTYTDPGVVVVNGAQIHNYDNQAHGVNTMTQVLEKSLNTGVIFVENLIGDSNFANYVVNFGFGQNTGIDMPGEVSGNISNLYSTEKVNFDTAAFGQGISVTPIQLITAYSAIANGGKLMKPYIVNKVIHEDGSQEITKPEVVSTPISPQTSATLRQMLVDVVDLGFDKARVKGYSIAGKTGTAQIPDSHGGYEQGTFIHDFLGFAPANDPKFVVLVKMDRPQGITFAADSLSPTFRDIAAYLLNYYNIPPDR